MSATRKIILGAVLAVAGMFGAGLVPSAAAEELFRELKGEHFIVKYLLDEERDQAARILNRAEDYYKRVAEDIGYSRYQDYWTWERRVNIVLYPDQLSYAKFTGQQKWSKGYASRDSKLFKTKVIVSFDGQPEFLEEILPHEIAHLMVWDFLGFSRKVPIWFEEGLAQLEEQGKKEVVQAAMQGVVSAGNEMPWVTFNGLDVTTIQDPVQVSLFYAQSLSVIEFMIEKYGKDAFRDFCRALRGGAEFEEALARAYPAIFRTLKDLEWKWKSYLLNEAILSGGTL